MRGWTDKDEAHQEMLARAMTLNRIEIQNHQEVAAEKIAEAMQELYLATGLEHRISVRLSRRDELDATTNWVVRYTYDVELSAVI